MKLNREQIKLIRIMLYATTGEISLKSFCGVIKTPVFKADSNQFLSEIYHSEEINEKGLIQLKVLRSQFLKYLKINNLNYKELVDKMMCFFRSHSYLL